MKKKIFLLAVIAPCIIAAIFMGVAFKSEKTPVTTEQISDGDSLLIAQEAQLQSIAYNTWLNDGAPNMEDLKTKFNHHCTVTEWFDHAGRADRLNWVLGMMGGWSNPNHVHSVDFQTVIGGECPYGPPGFPCYKATVKIWTSSPCGTFGATAK